MDYFRQVREQDFELNISLSEALYRRGEESITFQLNQDGLVECNGSKQCLHDLYQVLSRRPDLRVHNLDMQYSEGEEKGTYPSEETEEAIKFLRIRDWLFGDDPTFKM